MERVIEWSLHEQGNKIGQISDFQHAYSGSKGTDTALSTLVNLIESAILRKQLCLVISVDIQGAFDNLVFMAIEKVMKDNNYPPLMIRWYHEFLEKLEFQLQKYLVSNYLSDLYVEHHRVVSSAAGSGF